MTKILFVCHGNISRSVMVESVMMVIVMLDNERDVEGLSSPSYNHRYFGTR